MAQLKDTTIQGSARVTDTLYSNVVQAKIFNIPTASNGTTYGPGTDGQVLKSNGASVYWASDSNSDINVKQLAAITTSGAYPIILANSTATTEVTGTVNKSANLTYNPSTKALSTGGTINGLTFTAASTGFTIAGGTTSKTLTVSNTYTLGAACAKGVTDNSSNADVTSSDTNLITGRTLYYQLAKKGYTTNTGTVTSVQVQASSPLQSSTSTAQSATLSTTISFTNQNANVVLAGPSSGSSAAAPTFRALVAADIPSLDWSKIGSGKPTTLSGYGITDAAASGHTQAVNKGGTNITSYTIGDILYASASTTLSKLAGNTTTTVKYLKSVAATSGTAVAPAWAQIAASEISGLGAAATKAVTDNSSNADVTSTDTNLITGRTLYYQLAKKGYTTNTGTVTSVTLTSGSGITVSDSGTAITGSGSRTISITGMNTSSGSTSKCLTEKGTWASFSNNSGTVTSVTLTSGAGITVSDSGTAITGSGSRTISITGVDTSSGSTTQCLTKKGTWASFTNNAGTVTSVQVAASAPLQSSTGTASSTTLSTTISFINQDPNTVLAGPSSGDAAAAPTFRALVAADIPNLSWNKITSDKPTTLSGYGITDGVSSSALESYLPLGGGDMTGTIKLAATAGLRTNNDAGWTMNQYGNITHLRSNTADTVGIAAYDGSIKFKVAYDSGNTDITGYLYATGGLYGVGVITRAATPMFYFQNASAQACGEIWSNSGRIYIRERPSAGSSYVTDIVFPTAKSNGNENVYVYTSRNFSLSGTTLTITVPS